MTDAIPASTPELMDEAAFLALWQTQRLHERSPREAALEGGRLADQLAWVFVSGYQAAMRSVFPEVHSDGWLAFAVSEDRQHPDEFPPLHVQADESEWLLTGCKSWVAQADHLSELVVTAQLRDRTELFRVASDIKGLTLSRRPEPGFLAAMSQGFARFDESPAARLDDPGRRKLFMCAEALAMMLAATGYLAKATPESNAAAVLARNALKDCVPELGAGLDALAQGQAPDALDMLALDERWHAGLEGWLAAVDTSMLPNFTVDQPLLSLYRKAIAHRARSSLDNQDQRS